MANSVPFLFFAEKNGCDCCMKFKEIVESRFAVKKFDGRKIPEQKISELLELIRLAPSSFNLQPWKIRVVSDEPLKQKLAPASFNQSQISTSSHVLVFLADTNLEGLIEKTEQQLLAKNASKEEIGPFLQMLRNFAAGMNPQQRVGWAQRQLFLALGNALNGAKALGFDSCPMEGFDAAAYSRILNLPDHLVPTVLCPVGFAADFPKPKSRFSIEDILVFESETIAA